MNDPRPGTIGADARWPLLAVLIEHTAAGARLTFAVSDVAPDGDIGPVVLGVDELTGDDGERFTFLACFCRGNVKIVTTRNGIATVDEDADVEYVEGAVVITTRHLPAARIDDRGPMGFCTIAGVPHQVDVPVLVFPPAAR